MSTKLLMSEKVMHLVIFGMPIKCIYDFDVRGPHVSACCWGENPGARSSAEKESYIQVSLITMIWTRCGGSRAYKYRYMTSGVASQYRRYNLL